MANGICRSRDRSVASHVVVGAVASVAEYRRRRREHRKARRCFPLLCDNAGLFAMPVACSDTRCASRCRSRRSRRSPGRFLRHRCTSPGPLFSDVRNQAFSFRLIKQSHLLMTINFQQRLTLNYRSLAASCTTESCGLSSGTGCTSPFFSAPLPRPTSSVSPSAFPASLFWSALSSGPVPDR